MSAELLAPAGDERTAQAALAAGADAIYLGLTRFSARESAENFNEDALFRITRRAHLLGAKVYVALNTLVKDSETEDFFAAVRTAYECGADAILMQDVFLGKRVKEAYPQVVLHLSTQGGCCNVYGAQLAKDCGFSRVVLARETPLSEIAAISKIIETEVFVQGALCTCFSGQCYLSSFIGNNSGNRGRCKQPCRKKYSIDRAGFEAPAYALSLSDLSAGRRLKEFETCGVSSFKIEGRMRRPEYCAAAVRYFRALLDGGDASHAFSALKRTYNRGDYTEGLAFGQREGFLSRKVQGHIGERVGVLTVRGGRLFCKSNYLPSSEDGFKILRDGEEVGGAKATLAEGGFFVSSPARLRAGDEVRLTTDSRGNASLFSPEKRRSLPLTVRLYAGEKARVTCEGFAFEGETVQPARSAPLTEEEVCACFRKTDGPFLVTVKAELNNAFLPKSALNAFRRAFFEAYASFCDPIRTKLEKTDPIEHIFPMKDRLTASIGGEGDIAIVKPSDYSHTPTGGKGKFLYLPPLFTEEDEREIATVLPTYEGIYCEGYYGVLLAKKYGIALFAGTGFNLTNRFSVAEVKRVGAKYFALSKEISSEEQRLLAAEGAFSLIQGAVKVMDLCYCPFSKTCSSCDRRTLYTLTDEAGRKFPLRRYKMGGNCRFEVYNCAPLLAEGVTSALCDETVKIVHAPTHGHSDRSVL